jgi:4'-phosphopantetheinyl transferase
MAKVNCLNLEITHWETVQPPDWEIQGLVNIWRVPVLEDSKIIDWGRPYLDPEENQRAQRFVQQQDRIRFLTGRAALRLLISMYTGSQPGEIEFGEGENKKPFIKNLPFAFYHNLAHSGEWVLIAFADSPLGIDLEFISDRFGFEEILTMVFSNNEIASIREANVPRSRFYQLWTRKEALAKATAKGLDNGIVSIPSLEGMHDVNIDLTGPGLSWNIFSFPLTDQYYGSVACPHDISRVRFFDLQAFWDASEPVFDSRKNDIHSPRDI